jgi:LPPG:FO 2-phospho-L-lactate transferase
MEIAALAIGASAPCRSHPRNGSARVTIVNTGNDYRLRTAISPDLDIVTYSLAGMEIPSGMGLSRRRSARTISWPYTGVRRGSTGRSRPGDAHSSAASREGATLSEAAESIRPRLASGKNSPMSDQPVPIDTRGTAQLQDLARAGGARGQKIKLTAGSLRQVLESLDRAAVIVICPSNPLISIGPILAVPGIREALRKRRKDVVAVCPIVGGKSLKGPSDRMLAQLGFDVSASGVARMYQDICATFLIDSVDAGERPAVEALGMKAVVCSTVMHTLEDKERLAGEALRPFVERTAGAGR